VLKVIIQAYVFPHIIYCLCVWGGAAKGQLYKIQKLINFAARIVTGSKKHQHITPALNYLGWPRIETLVSQRDAIKVHKVLRVDGMPAELRAMFVTRSAVSDRRTRASEQGILHLPKCRLAATQNAFSYRAVVAWNSLSSSTRAVQTVGAFRSALPT